jgi:lipoprotein-anchoring transpeptidase ErfK/SrfK
VNGTGKHSIGRLGVTSAVAALAALTAIAAAVLSVGPAASRTPAPGPVSGGTASGGTLSGGTVTGAGSPYAGPPAPGARAAAGSAGSATASRPVSLVVTAADRRACTAAATACVDLTRHITWLQSGGKVGFGPVQMEPGKPGGGHETPRGTFHVAWKAGAVYESTTYHEPMPWATFFAAGGIAFHGGPLTEWSHGCVHLTDSNAHYYNEHLPIGAEVVVF